MMNDLPGFDAVLAAAARIAPHARRTPVLRSQSLDALAGAELHFKCENLQRSGAFKFRGACNAVWALDAETAARGVVTHSSGNHGAALALAARGRGIAAHVVVPEGAVAGKVAAIEAAGATLHWCAPTIAAREARAEQVQRETGATLVHPYADPCVIAGQGTAALELLSEAGPLDALVTPAGGGGLVCGSAIAAHGRNSGRGVQGHAHDAQTAGPGIAVFGAEPEGAADTFESLRQGRRITDIVPDTICDGLRGTVGEINLQLMRRHGIAVLLVSDEEVLAAMRLLLERLKVLVEPSGATALAAVLRHRHHFAGRRIGLILSGGNADVSALFDPSRTA